MSLSADGVREAVAAEIEELGPPPRSHRNKVIRLVSVIAVLAAWEVFGRQVEPLFMSYPTAIAVSGAT